MRILADGLSGKRALLRSACCALLVLGAGDFLPSLDRAAQAQRRTERTEEVASPDRARTVAVEWEALAGWGEGVEFPGRMNVRVGAPAGSSKTPASAPAVRQWQIDAPQVRSVQRPLWLDDRWAAYSYNVQKNFNGMVYLDARDGAAYQVEMVAPVRRQGATGALESDLTSLDVTVHGTTETVSFRNVTRGRSSVFPLVLRPLPAFASAPYPRSFLDELRGASDAYSDWLTSYSLAGLRLEQGSESFAPDDRHLALLACGFEAPDASTTPVAVLILAPVGAPSAREALDAARLIRLDPVIQPSCWFGGNAEGGESAAEAGPASLVRYSTRWIDAATVAVDREVTDDVREELETVPVYTAAVSGEATKLPAADKLPEMAQPPPGGWPEPEEHDEEDDTKPAARNAESAGKPGARPDRSERPDRRKPRRTPAPAASPASPASSPAAPASSPASGGRRLPGVSAPGAAPSTRPPSPTPYVAEPIPNLLQRLPGFREPVPAPAPATSPAPGPGGQSGNRESRP